MPWLPAVDFQGKTGERMEFSRGYHRYSVRFTSADAGVLVNLSIGIERPLRRVLAEVDEQDLEPDVYSPSLVVLTPRSQRREDDDEPVVELPEEESRNDPLLHARIMLRLPRPIGPRGCRKH